jgi:hypothetical protein
MMFDASDDEDSVRMAVLGADTSQVSATPARMPRLTHKSAMQRKRRILTREHTSLVKAQNLVTDTGSQLSHVLAATDGILHAGSDRAHSHATAIRVSMAPLTIGNKALESMLGICSSATITRLRVRVASCLRNMNTIREKLAISDLGDAIRQVQIRSSASGAVGNIANGVSGSFASIAAPAGGEETDSDMDLVDAAIAIAADPYQTQPRTLALRVSNEELFSQSLAILRADQVFVRPNCSLVPLVMRDRAGGRAGFSILGLGWKWDGTPIHASVRQRIVEMELGAAPRENCDESALLLSFLTGQGAECFSQRGTFVKAKANGDTGAFTKLVISIPPKDLRDKTADGLLTALEVEQHIDRLIKQSDRLASFYTDDVGNVSKLQFVIVVPLTIDAAATNIAAINKLLVKYRHYNATNVSGVLVLIATHLCLPHQVHIASRTVFASVQLPLRSKTTGKKIAGQRPPSNVCFM